MQILKLLEKFVDKMKIKELINKIETEFKPEYAMPGDKVGLQIQSGNTEVNNILVAYEINNDVINEAIINKVDFILSFHPLIYSSLDSITNDSRVGDLVTKLIKNSISLYVIHTCFDAHPKGTNYLLAQKLKLNITDVLAEYQNQNGIGMGVIAELGEPISSSELITKVKDTINPNLRYNDDIPKIIKRIAIVGGSGFSFIGHVIDKQCDAFITADITYHKFHEINSKILLIDAGHYETEQFITDGVFKLVNGLLQENVNILVSKINSNPVSYI